LVAHVVFLFGAEINISLSTYKVLSRYIVIYCGAIAGRRKEEARCTVGA
jgi:hypothetical protein